MVAFRHLSDKSLEPMIQRPKFRSSLFQKLDSADACFLESEFTQEEIRGAVWNCGGSISPGPDGLNFNSLKRFWDFFKPDFINCVKYFQTAGHFSRGCNPSFTVIIPKKMIQLIFWIFSLLVSLDVFIR